jgi:hypothetical protein
MTRGLASLAALAALAIVGSSRSARAQVEVPRGDFGVSLQISQNAGETGEAYRLAWLGGVKAGYEPLRFGKSALGAAWSLAGGQYFVADDQLPDDTVGVLEMSLGVRFRRLLGTTTPRFLAIGAGGTILRIGRALPPDNKRVYLGPYATIGLDQYLGTRVLLSFMARYGLIETGPASLGLRISVSIGS